MATAKVAISIEEELISQIDEMVKRRVLQIEARRFRKRSREKSPESTRVVWQLKAPNWTLKLNKKWPTRDFQGDQTVARVLRGDVFWANLNPVRGKEQAGFRPVLVISHDVFPTNVPGQ